MSRLVTIETKSSRRSRTLLAIAGVAAAAVPIIFAHGCSGDGDSSAGSGNSGTGASTSQGGNGTGGLAFGGQGIGGMPGPCSGRSGESFCDGHTYVHCSGTGTVASEENCKVDGTCSPGTCVDGEGCLRCEAGQLWCDGPNLMSCDTTANPVAWQLVQTCGAGQACDVKQATCTPIPVIGDTTATGSYFQYANFRYHEGSPNNDVYLGGMDVGSYGDYIYVHRELTGGLYGSHNAAPFGVDVYKVELLDSDADGELEPNQHPDNPDHPGPIEERVLTLVETIETPIGGMHCSEIYPLEDRMYSIQCAGIVTEYMFNTGVTTIVASAQGPASFLGFDDVNETWIVGSETRQVHAFHGGTNQWVPVFQWPDLAGSHGDGMEVVTDRNTMTPYVYISDMTSDFLGQYRCDPEEGWVRENLFDYVGTAEDYVEGMGFGALGHFWVSTVEDLNNGMPNVLKEIGGNDLGVYTDPPPDVPK
jgi:hypothetical protein